MRMTAIVSLATAMLAGIWVRAIAQETPRAPSVEEAHLGLSSGPLRAAHLVALPEGAVLQAGETQITAEQVAAEIEKAKQDPETYAALQKNAFFVLEKLGTRALLLDEARRWAQEASLDSSKQTDLSLIETYLGDLASQVQVTKEESHAFFAANQEMFGGATYEQVAQSILSYLEDQRRAAAVAARINTLSERASVGLDAAWVATQAATALDTAVDRARRSGKPTVADFGATGCGQCDMMTPILEELGQAYGEQCNVLFVQVGEEPILAARYGIESIPVQVFFDREGKEFHRHSGFYPKGEIVAKLMELGVEVD